MMNLSTLVVLVLAFGLACACSAEVKKTQANTVSEISFTSKKVRLNPFIDVTLDVEFSDPKGKKTVAPAFWAGGNVWKVRYSSPVIGVHKYRTICIDTHDSGLHGISGSLTIEPFSGSNPLYKHGMLRVAEDKRHFAHADGTPFFWLGDTWWKCLAKRMDWAGFKELADDRAKKGFSVVQIVCGAYPDELAFQQMWENEGGKPYLSADFNQVNPAYFDYADRRFAYLVDKGIVPAIVGGWGRGDCDAIATVGLEGMKRHWRYLVARYWAYPTVWIVGGESRGPQWTELAKMIRAIDPVDRPITLHPDQSGRLSVTDESAVNFDMLQTGHGDMSAAIGAIPKLKEAYDRKPAMPALIGEFCYEGHMQSAFQDVERYVFWASLNSGAAGLTYGAAGVWHASVEGDPGVQSAPGVNRVYDYTTWREGMAYPGSTQLGIGKKLLKTLPWQRFAPHPEWAADGCFAAGIPGEARVIYMPKKGVYNWSGTVVNGLEPGATYQAYFFDPVRGTRFDLETFTVADSSQSEVFSHTKKILFADRFSTSANNSWQDIGKPTKRENGEMRCGQNTLSVVRDLKTLDVTASVDTTSGAEAGIVLRFHDKDNYVVALYSPVFHSIYIHDRRNGQWGDRLGEVPVGNLGPNIHAIGHDMRRMGGCGAAR